MIDNKELHAEHNPQDHYIRPRETGYPFSRYFGLEEEVQRGVDAILKEGALATSLNNTQWKR